MKEIQKSLELKAELDSLRPLKQDDEARVMQKLRLDWNYHSNNLEGNSLTYGETKSLILFGLTTSGKPLKDHLEVTGHNEAVEWILDLVKGDFSLSEHFIRQLHQLLLRETYYVDAITTEGKPTRKKVEVGKYKTEPNHVLTKTGEIFRFATPEETPFLMSELIQWYEEQFKRDNVNPIFLASEFHYKFIQIHPFDDGNGRVIRLLMNFILMKFGYPPAVIKTQDKANYYAALQQADSGTIESFIDYIAQNLNRSLEIMIRGAKGQDIEEPDDLDKEIALLDQKLKAHKERVPQTDEAILEICKNSVLRLYNKFIEAGKKFEGFYYGRETKLIVGDNNFHLRKEVLWKILLITIKEDFLEKSGLTYVEMSRVFTSFNRVGFEKFDFESSINFEFRDGEYIVSVECSLFLGLGGFKITKLYNEQLTDDEMDELIRTIKKAHKEFIEEKTKEKN
jgi:Fic family protein